MAAALVQRPPLRQTPTPPPQHPSLSLNTSTFENHVVPNKHIPYCSPGPPPSSQPQSLATPPASPPTKNASIQIQSTLHPADEFDEIHNDPPIYRIDASTLAVALKTLSAQALPEPKDVFPWLHGLHQENQLQLAFFLARRKVMRATPRQFRGITIVKADGDLTNCQLKGAVAPEEILCSNKRLSSSFLEIDPKDGFSVRNFQIQAAKLAIVSDIVVYLETGLEGGRVPEVAKRLASAQAAWRQKRCSSEQDVPEYNTFVVSSMVSLDLTQLLMSKLNDSQILFRRLKRAILSLWRSTRACSLRGRL